MKLLTHGLRWAAVLTVGLLLGCERPPPARAVAYRHEPPTGTSAIYRFAVHPLHNPALLLAAYQPLVDHLNRQLKDTRIELEASRDYQAYEAKYTARGPAFLLPNPWQTLQARKFGYHVIAMAGDASDFKGIFLVRRDSTIRQPQDLKGKAVSYPSYTALAACIMPQFFLHQNGVNVRNDIRNLYVGSQESAMMNVYLGQAAVGATWPPPWRLFQKQHPKEAAALKVIWETQSLVNNSVMVRDDVPHAVRDQVAQVLLSLAQHADGPRILSGMETARFAAANDACYDIVARYVENFERDVRSVQSP